MISLLLIVQVAAVITAAILVSICALASTSHENDRLAESARKRGELW